MKTPMMVELEGLDPARDLRAPGRADDPALQTILGTDRSAVKIRRAPRPALVASAAAAAVVAVAVGVTLTSTLTSTPAYASWTPVPTAVPADAVAERTAACDSTAQEIDTTSGEPEVVDVPVEPVLTEARGDYTYVVLAGDGAYGDCFVTTGAAAQDVVGSSAVLPEPLAPPGARELTTVQSGTASWSEGGTGDGALTSAFGQAGDEVVGVEATLGSGETVEASVENGWWAVWAPGSESLGTSAVVSFADGTTAQVEIDAGD